MSNLKKAKNLLHNGDFTCVLVKDEEIYTSLSRGIKPLADWYKSATDFEGFSAADKVVGKGAAFIYALLNIEALWADVISRSALEVLEKHGIKTEYQTLVENIKNRSGDGICPFEAAVLDIGNAFDAWNAILNKMKELGI
ncbi:MAG: DUF1893 domain-containing protein [Clostridia bacterium]|nr:DUF1893 domain-containing protein [Clostridia bacterium]